MPHQRTITMEVPGLLNYRDDVLRSVSAVCRAGQQRHGWTDQVRDELQNLLLSAVGEAFNNIAIHGYRDRPVDVVQVVADAGPNFVSVELRDFGNSHDPGQGEDPNMAQLPESGMGTFIMRKSVDELHYEPGCPNVLRMTRFVR